MVFLDFRQKKLKNICNLQKKVKTAPKKCFDQLSGVRSTQIWSKYTTAESANLLSENATWLTTIKALFLNANLD